MTGAIRSVPIGPDIELRIEALEDAGRQVLDLRLRRRTPAGADADPKTAPPGEWVATPAGFRIPLALVPGVVEVIERVTRQAAQAALWRDPARPAGDVA